MIKKKQPDSIKHILVAPALFMFVAITIFPLIFNVIMSLCNWKLGGSIRFLGLSNYIWAFKNNVFWKTMGNTVLVTLISVTVEYLLALLLAYNINKLIFGKKIIRVLMLLPMLMAPVVIGFMWKQLFNELYGPLNYFLRLLGVEGVPWISKRGYSMTSIILVDVWEWTPFIILILLAGLQSIPKEPIESARVDGASEWQIFKDIIFKMLMPSSIVAITLRSIETFKIFDTIYITTAGGPGVSSMSSSMYAYQVGLRNFSLGKSAALCVIMLIFLMLVSQIVQKVQANRKKKQMEIIIPVDVDFSQYEEEGLV